MTNHEKYKKAFSALQTSKRSFQEVENMAKLQKRTKIKTAAAESPQRLFCNRWEKRFIRFFASFAGEKTPLSLQVCERSECAQSGCN